METDIDGINHVGLIAADVDEVSATYERLGFTLTPLSMHQGSWTPGGGIVKFGSGNRCAVFESNYLEISVHADRSLDDRGINAFLARFAGLHIVCFGCGDAATVDRRLRGAGLSTSGVIPLQREIDTPAGPRLARFDCVHVEPGRSPEGRVQAARHHNPEYVLQPRYQTHANGALALTDAILAVDDVPGYLDRYRRVLGREPERRGPAWVFDLPLGRFTVVAGADVPALLPGERVPALPALVGFGVACADPDRTRRYLDGAGVPVMAVGGGRFLVSAGHAAGAAIVFGPAGHGLPQ